MKKQRSEDHDFALRKCSGEPETVTDLLNKYGTYEVQDTADTENELPAIAQGLPESQKKKTIEKEDVGKEPR